VITHTKHPKNNAAAKELFATLIQYQNSLVSTLARITSGSQADKSVLISKLLAQPPVARSVISFLVSADKSAKSHISNLLTR